MPLQFPLFMRLQISLKLKTRSQKLIFIGGIGTKDRIGDAKHYSRNVPQGNRVYSDQGISCSITSNGGSLGGSSGLYLINANQRIRKLTPLECWRLQGFSDEQFKRASNAGVSNHQLYKQAGNAVTVSIIQAIANQFEIKEL